MDNDDEKERRRLTALIRESAAPMVPSPPPLPAEFESLVFPGREAAKTGGIRAVLFDVYGTLFCSAAGDIGSSVAAAPGADSVALQALAEVYDMSGAGLRAWFREKVAEIHRASYTEWPEVRVEDIWRRLPHISNAAAARELALRYELAVNPVYPMPCAAETIAALRCAGCVLGIISNAQFFTPLLFEAFFGAPPEGLGFDPDLLIWSYETGEAKPSPRLFETAARRLAGKGITPEACAFAGNDMLSDMYGAVNAGFRGVLFAGDSRSLRLREQDSRVRGLRPWRVIRNLPELAKLLCASFR